MSTEKTQVSRGGAKKTATVIAKASADDAILIRPITDTMAMFGLSHRTATRARNDAERRVMKESGSTGLKTLELQKAHHRLENTLRRTEQRYPGLLREILKSENLAGTGRDHGNLTRERVRQLRETILDVAAFRNTTPGRALRAVLSKKL